IFATAIAMRTKRVLIGLAVVQMALHNPVRLAVQTAVVDQLSKGRLLVGTGGGSGFSTYKDTGFGAEMGAGRGMSNHARDPLVRAGTGSDAQHEGKYWTVSSPGLRPRPPQQPHPPLLRGCASEESTIEMAKLGRPVLFGSKTPADVQRRSVAFRNAMSGAG